MPKIDVNGYFGPSPVRIEGMTDEREFLCKMDALGIEKCLVKSTIALFYDTEEVSTVYDTELGNLEMLSLVGRHPDRFIGAAMVDPDMEDMENTICSYRQRGAKALVLYPLEVDSPSPTMMLLTLYSPKPGTTTCRSSLS